MKYKYGSKLLLAMSGGVDSTVAAWLAKQQGYNCNAAAMKLCDDTNTEGARVAAQQLEMPFHVFDFTAEFRRRVIEPFVQMYWEGRTPNPCVVCNRHLKFGQFMCKAEELGIPLIATGHYAQIELDAASNRYLLKRAVDETKDQSYMLYTLTQTQLAKTMFPLGTLQKNDVRAIAESQGFANAQTQDSQDLCFVPDGDYATFIERYKGQHCPAGNFVDKAGKILGEHKGMIRYTIGQRKGLGIAAAAPYYVCGHNVNDNTITLGSPCDLFVRALSATDINFIPFDRLDGSLRAIVKVRYRQRGDWAMVRQISEDTIYIEFDEPQKAIALGQAAVLYDGDYVIGGGTISQVYSSDVHFRPTV